MHVYPAPFPMERLHLTRGGRPDAAAMQEAACAWVAAQAKPRRRSAATSAAPAGPTAATGGMDERPQEQAEQQAGVAQRGSRGGGGGGGADAGGAAAGGVSSISTLGQITSTDPHRADMIPDTIAGSSRSTSSDSSGSSSGSSPSYGGGCSGVCGRALEQARGAPRLLLCSWSSRGVAAAAVGGAHSAHAATAGASAGATPAAGMAGAPEDEAAEEPLGPTRVQQHLAASVLSQNCRWVGELQCRVRGACTKHRSCMHARCLRGEACRAWSMHDNITRVGSCTVSSGVAWPCAPPFTTMGCCCSRLQAA